MSAASAVQALAGVARAKIVAVVLGSAGVGVYGLLLSLTQTVALLGTMGLDMVGPRQVSKSHDSEANLSASIRAISFLLSGLAGLTGTAMLVLREPLAEFMGMPTAATEIGWLSVAVVTSVLAVLPLAVMQGMRKVDSLARVTFLGAVVSLVVGGLAVAWNGRFAVVILICSAPVCLLLIGLPSLMAAWHRMPVSAASLRLHVGQLAVSGWPYMLIAVVTIGSTFAARNMVFRIHGTEALGLYTAATTIGLTYATLVIGSLGTDFLPRISSVIDRRDEAAILIADQREIVLLIVVPVAVGIIALAPWLLALLFSAPLRLAAPILQLQVLADIVRVSAWPLGFVLLARGEGAIHLGIELAGQILFLAATVVLSSRFGVLASGAAFLVLSISTSILSHGIVGRRVHVVRNRGRLALVMVGLTVGLVTILASTLSPLAGAAVGVSAASVLGIYSLTRLARLAAFTGSVGRLVDTAASVLRRAGVRI